MKDGGVSYKCIVKIHFYDQKWTFILFFLTQLQFKLFYNFLKIFEDTI